MGGLSGHFLPTMRDHGWRKGRSTPSNALGKSAAKDALKNPVPQPISSTGPSTRVVGALGSTFSQSSSPSALLLGVAVVRRGATGEILDDARFETRFHHTGCIPCQARSTRSQHARACVRGSAWPASATMASALLGSSSRNSLGPLHRYHAVAAAVQNEHLCCGWYRG